MKKLLAIVVLGLLWSGCSKKDRMDEFSCTFDSDGSGPKYITLMNDYIQEEVFIFPIKKETKDKIIGIIFEGQKTEIYTTFYKRTKKYKKEYKSGDIYLLTCVQLN